MPSYLRPRGSRSWFGKSAIAPRFLPRYAAHAACTEGQRADTAIHYSSDAYTEQEITDLDGFLRAFCI